MRAETNKPEPVAPGNPDGKGLTPVLAGIAAYRPSVAVPPKAIDQISRELFTSLFVLEASFQFRPVVGRGYWLYRVGERFRLSLVTPREWGRCDPFGQPIGEAVLQPDMTWTLSLQPAAAVDPVVMRLIGERRATLTASLEKAGTLDEVLPDYAAHLPFQRRVLAAGLAHSLRRSMQGADIVKLSYRQALRRLTAPV